MENFDKSVKLPNTIGNGLLDQDVQFRERTVDPQLANLHSILKFADAEGNPILKPKKIYKGHYFKIMRRQHSPGKSDYSPRQDLKVVKTETTETFGDSTSRLKSRSQSTQVPSSMLQLPAIPERKRKQATELKSGNRLSRNAGLGSGGSKLMVGQARSLLSPIQEQFPPLKAAAEDYTEEDSVLNQRNHRRSAITQLGGGDPKQDKYQSVLMDEAGSQRISPNSNVSRHDEVVLQSEMLELKDLMDRKQVLLQEISQQSQKNSKNLSPPGSPSQGLPPVHSNRRSPRRQPQSEPKQQQVAAVTVESLIAQSLDRFGFKLTVKKVERRKKKLQLISPIFTVIHETRTVAVDMSQIHWNHPILRKLFLTAAQQLLSCRRLFVLSDPKKRVYVERREHFYIVLSGRVNIFTAANNSLYHPPQQRQFKEKSPIRLYSEATRPIIATSSSILNAESLYQNDYWGQVQDTALELSVAHNSSEGGELHRKVEDYTSLEQLIGGDSPSHEAYVLAVNCGEFKMMKREWHASGYKKDYSTLESLIRKHMKL